MTSRKPPFKGNIERLTTQNTFYRKVLYTVPRKMQLVVMSLPPKTEIGMEVHRTISQFIRVEKGRGVAIVGNRRFRLRDDDAVIIPPGIRHNIINSSPIHHLKIYTIYSPPEHPPNTREKVKID